MTIKKGDRVSVNYEGRFEDGEVFDSSIHGDHSHPLIFVVGEHQVIPGFENAVIGLNQGDRKEVTIKPVEAYGEHNPLLVTKVKKSELNLPRNQAPKEGMTLVTYTPDGHQVPIRIVSVTEDSVSLDLNHPLAGRTLIFKIEVLGINETVKEDAHHH